MMMDKGHAISELDAKVITLGKTAKFIAKSFKPNIFVGTTE